MGTSAARVGGKRKRGGTEVRSEQDKFAHKSSVLLQREAKKVRAFQVRKVVQQLKQTRSQLDAAQRELEPLASDDGTSAADKKRKQVAKMSSTVAKLENELAVFKALDLKAVVARALDTTGLTKQHARHKALAQQQQEAQAQQAQAQALALARNASRAGDGHYGPRLADPSDSDSDNNDADGFDSDGGSGAGRDASGSENESESESEQDVAASAAATTESIAPDAATVDTAPPTAAKQLETQLIDRILAHKQMKPLLDAIEKVLANDERALEKKLRQHEKNARKRASHDVLIGGRSAAAPTSLFVGSLSGLGDMDDVDNDVTTTGYLAGADDDIAAFLGETKKKKNRMGQLARKQKALRIEEAAKRRQERAMGVFRPSFDVRKDDGKYGLSERPKKQKVVERSGSARKPSTGRTGSGGTTFDGRRSANVASGAPAGRRDRERGAPSSSSSSSAAAAVKTTRRMRAAPVDEASHPSWIAKQALKEKQKASLGAFSGKKITFHDD